MRKERYVTPGLVGIREQIAEASRQVSGKTAAAETDGTGNTLPPVSIFESLPEETRKALRTRLQEYGYNRKDLLFRLHEFLAKVTRMESDVRKQAEALGPLKASLESLLLQLDQQQEPDEFSSDFQTRLSENHRALDHIRLDLIQLQSELPEEKGPENAPKSAGLFSELDSVSFGQLFRIGAGLFMPVILILLLSGILISVVILLTFRV